MTELTRTLRFCPTGDPAAPRVNAHAAWPPPPPGVVAGVVELRVTLAGTPDAGTGLLVNVKEVDRVFARSVFPSIDPARPAATLLRTAADAFCAALPAAVVRLGLHPSPRSSLTLDPADMNRVTLRQRSSFSAAHRLHAPSLTEAENLALFGKCHRPGFHGHNYELETVATAAVDGHGRSLDPADLDLSVQNCVIDVLDHRNLSTEVAAFADRNPTVEHIAETCFGLLTGNLPAGATLVEVTVWETDRTSCTFRPS